MEHVAILFLRKRLRLHFEIIEVRCDTSIPNCNINYQLNQQQLTVKTNPPNIAIIDNINYDGNC